ncbi:hypothetical protein SAMN04488055_1026 [Chitinophaga niabensis]|uniref:Terpene synthase n=2 Tax=Chitinophaga niabensis TaxID=536979 RepID=A0A1N6DRV0_9BACT|nr:hypothetical protein SAMN04488055_1026 [Chitinophaga niabensis]
METITSIPDLYCPYPSRMSPYVEEVAAATDAWMKRFALFPSEQAFTEFSNYKMAWMTCRTIPDGDLPLLITINNFYSWLFVLDEQLDHISPETAAIRDKNFLQNFISGFVKILRNDQFVSIAEGGNVLAAFSDIWQNLIPASRASWQCQFTISLKATFEAAIWEAANANSETPPTVKQYMRMRPYFSGANLGTDINELATATSLPVYVLQDQDFVRIVDLCRRVVCWANDIFSLAKEIAHGDNHNLVMVLKYNEDLTMEKALNEAARIHDYEMHQIEQLRRKLPDFGPQLNKDVKAYLDGLETMVSGFFWWSLEDTPRYMSHLQEKVV